MLPTQTQIEALRIQVGSILTIIRTAEDCEELRKARTLIEFSATLWTTTFPDGDVETETCKRAVVNRAEQIIRYEYDYLATARKNDKHRLTTEKHIRDLKDLAETMK